MTKMTNQEAFDKMVTHLASMKEACIDESGQCVYWKPDGNRCAVGALLTEEEAIYFTEVKPGLTAPNLVDDPKCDSISHLDPCLLDDVQTVHDDWTPGKEIRWEELMVIAQEYALDTTVLEKVST